MSVLLCFFMLLINGTLSVIFQKKFRKPLYFIRVRHYETLAHCQVLRLAPILPL